MIAKWRTLEQKISDAGPFDQRIDPHVLTNARDELLRDGRMLKRTEAGIPWFYLPNTQEQALRNRLDEQASMVRELNSGNLSKRIGQCLEISTYRSLLLQEELEYFGRFKDLNRHDDSILFSREEPPQSISGRELDGDERLDFLIRHPQAGWAGIEVKNIRQWLYPSRQEIADLIRKAVALDCVPILIARRFSYVTFHH